MSTVDQFRRCSAASSECALPIRLTLFISAEDKADRLEACTALLPPEVAEPVAPQEEVVAAVAEPVAPQEAVVAAAAEPVSQQEAVEAVAAEPVAQQEAVVVTAARQQEPSVD